MQTEKSKQIIPYTYRVIHIPSGKWYYGVRYGEGCHPDDLWVKYFTSSDKVRELIKRDGEESFRTEIRQIFETPAEAIDWESRVLKRILGWSQCLNESRFPAVTPEARTRGNEIKRQIQDDGLTIFQRAGKKWKERQDQIDPVTGLTFREIRRRKFNEALDRNGTRSIIGASLPGDLNPSKRPEVAAKISSSLKEGFASGRIVNWATGKKLQYASDKWKGNQLVAGTKWHNDGVKDYRLLPTDPLVETLKPGRLIRGNLGHDYPDVTCPHCGKVGSGGNMKRYHFDNCKSK